jgi:hypothetical protein
MHAYLVEDDRGDLVEVVPLCSDSCHRDYCRARGVDYGGWNGCQESGSDEWCAQCGIRCGIGSDESECSAECLPVVVNILGPIAGGCAHGRPFWIDPALTSADRAASMVPRRDGR